MAFNWTCPYCSKPQTVVEANSDSGTVHFYVGESAFGNLGLYASAICCSNPDCKKISVNAAVRETVFLSGNRQVKKGVPPHYDGRLLPNTDAVVQPDFIPAPIREDYYEACRIRDLSPKASATLSRRCLQGMIRDFCGITKGTLFKEIDELRAGLESGDLPKGVSEDSIDAIDALRKIGNIGAHMEKDINLIVDVDPEEAQTLIEIIETLFEEWYIAREKRKTRFAKILQIADQKDAEKKENPLLEAAQQASDK